VKIKITICILVALFALFLVVNLVNLNSHFEPYFTDTEIRPEFIELGYFIDDSESLSADAVIGNDSLFTITNDTSTRFGHTPYPIWIKMVLRNPGFDQSTWVIDTGNNFMTQGEIFELKGSSFSKIYDHAHYKTSALYYQAYAMASEITIEPLGVATLYLRYQSAMSTHLDLKILSFDEAMYNYNRLKLFYGTGIAILLVFTLFSLFLYYTFESYLYLLHSLQVILLAALTVAVSGAALAFPWVNLYSNDSALTVIAILIFVTCQTMFAREFLRKVAPRKRLSRYFLVLIGLQIVVTLLVFFDSSRIFAVQNLGPGTVTSSYIFIAVSTLILSRQPKGELLLFLGAWFSMGIGFMIYILNIMDIYPIEIEPHISGIYFGGLVYVFLVSWALALQFSRLQRESTLHREALVEVFFERIAEAEEMQVMARERNDALEKSAEKAGQIASASHDIHGHILLLKLKLAELQAGDQKIVQELGQGMDYLTELAEEIVEVEKLDTGGFEALISVEGLFEDLEQEFGVLTNAKGLKLKFRTNVQLVSGSYVMLKRIISNLLGNAVRCTRRGGVLVAFRSRTTHLLLQVIDTGRGMSEDHQKKLSAPHEPIDGGDGFGMGLHIVSNFCRVMGFELSISSVVGRGTTVSVIIPLQRLRNK
jgi:two-component system, sensor histidine kinase LadS